MAAAAASAKGNAYLAEADKALKKTSIFGSLLGTNKQKFEEAAELYVKAGNSFKLANQWQSAGEAFALAAQNMRQTESPGDAVNQLVEAGNCFKKINPSEAIKMISEAIAMYNDQGRFAMSARFYKEIAELYETEKDISNAIDCYENAANLFNGDNKKQNAQGCMLKIATLSSEAGDYIKAAAIFEQCGRDSMESNLGKYSAKGYLFQSLLCHLAAGDMVAVRSKIETFKSVDYTFSSSRECAFVEKLVEASDKMNDSDFGKACEDFDKITPLDNWKLNILSAAKDHIGSGDGEVDLS